jgi:hypothetical protein
MPEIIRSENASNEPILVELDVSFKIPKPQEIVRHINNPTENADNLSPFEFEIKIDGEIKKGRITTKRTYSILHGDKGNFPADDYLTVILRDPNEQVRVTPETAPLSFRMEIDNLTGEQIRNLECNLVVDGKKFEGYCLQANNSVPRGIRQNLSIEAWGLFSPTIHSAKSYFSPRSDLFDRVSFLIEKD